MRKHWFNLSAVVLNQMFALPIAENGVSGRSSVAGDYRGDYDRRRDRLPPLEAIHDGSGGRGGGFTSRETSAIRRYFNRNRGPGGGPDDERGRADHETGFGGPNRRRHSSGVDDGYDAHGDDVILVNERPRSSPILVRLMRAMTPRRAASARTATRPGYSRQSSVNRVFQIVKEGYNKVYHLFQPFLSFFSLEPLRK